MHISILMVSAAVAAIPPVLYAISGVCARTGLRKEIPSRIADYQDTPQNAALTLAGFSFTALALFVTIMDAPKTITLDSIQVAVFFHEAALGFFMLAYLILRFRERLWQIYASDLCMDSGLWSIVLGLLGFCRFTEALRPFQWIVVAVALALLVYIAVNIRNWVAMANKAARDLPI